MAKLKTGRHTSAIKANRQSRRRALRNRALKKNARVATKALLASVASKDKEQAEKQLSAVSSAWDKARKKGIVHWKTVARRKARLAARVRKIAAK